MWISLIGSIELFSNHKSFSLQIDTKRNLWFLLHFKHLEIKSKSLFYQVNNGIRQRKSTVHPVRKMQKKFKNTLELLDYIDYKPYDILRLEIEFTNGWKIKQQPFIYFRFYTNSTDERNELINKLISISGQGPVDILSLKENLTYFYRGSDKYELLVNDDELPSPDEFWSKQKRDDWIKAVTKKDYKEEVQEEISDHSDNSFISTMDIDFSANDNNNEPWNIDNDDNDEAPF